MAIHNDFSWFRGEDVLITFTMTPLTDITAWTITCVLKPTLDNATVLLTVAATVTSAAAGIYTVAFTAAQNTTTLSAGIYQYAVERTDSGSVAVLSEGTMQIKPTAKLS